MTNVSCESHRRRCTRPNKPPDSTYPRYVEPAIFKWAQHTRGMLSQVVLEDLLYLAKIKQSEVMLSLDEKYLSVYWPQVPPGYLLNGDVILHGFKTK